MNQEIIQKPVNRDDSEELEQPSQGFESCGEKKLQEEETGQPALDGRGLEGTQVQPWVGRRPQQSIIPLTDSPFLEKQSPWARKKQGQ